MRRFAPRDARRLPHFRAGACTARSEGVANDIRAIPGDHDRSSATNGVEAERRKLNEQRRSPERVPRAAPPKPEGARGRDPTLASREQERVERVMAAKVKRGERINTRSLSSAEMRAYVKALGISPAANFAARGVSEG